jgi:hypothetical protein
VVEAWEAAARLRALAAEEERWWRRVEGRG